MPGKMYKNSPMDYSIKSPEPDRAGMMTGRMVGRNGTIYNPTLQDQMELSRRYMNMTKKGY